MRQKKNARPPSTRPGIVPWTIGVVHRTILNCLTVLRACLRMNRAVAGVARATTPAAACPVRQASRAPRLANWLAELGRLAVHFHDHVAGLQAGIVRRAARAHVLHHHAVHVVRHVELLPRVRVQIGHGQADLALLPTVVAFVAGFFGLRRGTGPPSGPASSACRRASRQASSAVPGVISLTATCRALAVDHLLAVHFASPRRPASGRRWLAGESGVTCATIAPEASCKLKKCALAGVTSLMLMPR